MKHQIKESCVNIKTKRNNKLDVIQRGVTKSSFKKWYGEFKKFMEIDFMPKMEVILYNDPNTPRCSVEHPTQRTGIHKVTANQLLIPIYGEKATRPIAFHEFTHIYDDYYLLTSMNNSEKHKYIWAYTEYHASYIEMMCALDFENINNIRRVTLDSIIHLGRGTKTLKNYLTQEKKDVILTFNTYMKNPTDELAVDAIRFMVYYFAKLDFLEKYCPDGVEYFDIGNTFAVKSVETSNDLHKKLQRVNANELSTFKEVYELTIQMGVDFLSNRR